MPNSLNPSKSSLSPPQHFWGGIDKWWAVSPLWYEFHPEACHRITLWSTTKASEAVVCVCVCYVSFECSSVLWRTLVFRTHSRAWNPVNAFWAISRLHRQVKDVQHDVNESTNCGTRSDVVTSNAVMSGTHWHTESCRSTPRHCTRVYSATPRTVSTSQEESGEPYLEVGFPERESR